MSPLSPKRPSIHIQRHPPERRQRRTLTAHCGCCCCCCCCLHSAGGLLGAAIGSAPPRTNPNDLMVIEDPDHPGELVPVYREPGHRGEGLAAGSYWGTLLMLVLLAVAFGLPGVRESREDPLLWLFVYLPAVQGVASVLSLFLVLAAQADRRELLQVGRIFVGSLIGTLLGLGLLWVICSIPGIR